MRTNMVVDKSTWGDGPWQHEPDRVEWEHAGLPCLAVRHPQTGNWCGYAAVPPGHPLHGLGLNDESPALAATLDRLKERAFDHEKDYTFTRGIAMLFGGELKPTAGVVIDVHGGLTYANKCHGPICHVAKAGEPDDVYWFGFDCGHAGDRSPGIDASLRAAGIDVIPHDYEYRTLDYVRAEVNRLAEQLRDVAA